MADERGDSGVGEPAFDSVQRPATAVGVRFAVLIEESAWRPGQSVAEDAQRAQIDADSLVPDHAGGLAENNAGLVDREDVPDRAGAQSWIGERAHLPQRNGLGVSQPGRVDDGTDESDDPVGLELGDGRSGEGFGSPRCHSSHSALSGGMNYTVILQVWPMSSVRSIRPMPNHIAHDRARSVISSSLKCSFARIPEVLVVAQAGVVARRSVRRTRPRSVLARCTPATSAIRPRVRRGPRRLRRRCPRRRECSGTPRIRCRARSPSGPTRGPASVVGSCCRPRW